MGCHARDCDNGDDDYSSILESDDVDWYIGTSASEEHATFIFRTLYWISLKIETKRCSETFVAVSHLRR